MLKASLPTIKIKAPAKKIVFASLMVASVASLTVVPYFFGGSRADTLTSAKVTISNSQANATGVTNVVSFKTASTQAVNVKSVVFDYCDSPVGTCNTPADFAFNAPNPTAVSSVSGIGSGAIAITNGHTITYTVGTPAEIAATTTVAMTFSNIHNPSTIAATYVRITTYDDQGTPAIIDGPTSTAFATLANGTLTATANVDSTFAFSVAGTPATTTTVAGNQPTDVLTQAGTIPFGTLTAGTAKTAAHDLTIRTNATNGYTVTVQTADDPMSDPADSTNKNIDRFSAGSNATPAVWVSNTTNNPNGTAPSVNTGYFGYTTNDSSLSGTATRFTASPNLWAGSDENTPSEVAYNVGSTSGSGDTVRVGWRVEVNSYQPNGNYTGTVTLVATPTF